uniref:RidA family protein n=1 Tax=candidate division WOR-3 bacterium TaxID=2052148 RepID=A0A7C6A8R9_UNCW3
MKEIVYSEKAPKPIGPYSQAVWVGNLIFLSGQIGIDPNTGELVAGGVLAETRQVMNNIGAILAKINLSFDNIIKTTIFLTNLADFAQVNQIYAEYFKQDFPARSTIEVKALPKGAKIKIEVIAQR